MKSATYSTEIIYEKIYITTVKIMVRNERNTMYLYSLTLY